MYYLGEIDVEEEGLLSVGDLNPVLLVQIASNVNVVYAFRDLFHCGEEDEERNPKPNPSDLR